MAEHLIALGNSYFHIYLFSNRLKKSMIINNIIYIILFILSSIDDKISALFFSSSSSSSNVAAFLLSCILLIHIRKFFGGSIYSESVCGKCDSWQKTMRKHDIKIYAFPVAIIPLASHLLQINVNVWNCLGSEWMDAESMKEKKNERES